MEHFNSRSIRRLSLIGFARQDPGTSSHLSDSRCTSQTKDLWKFREASEHRAPRSPHSLLPSAVGKGLLDHRLRITPEDVSSIIPLAFKKGMRPSLTIIRENGASGSLNHKPVFNPNPKPETPNPRP